jgi:hypothetical protein
MLSRTTKMEPFLFGPGLTPGINRDQGEVLVSHGSVALFSSGS